MGTRKFAEDVIDAVRGLSADRSEVNQRQTGTACSPGRIPSNPISATTGGAIEPALDSVAVLAGIVPIRTFLSVSLKVEIDGKWPWQQRKEGET